MCEAVSMGLMAAGTLMSAYSSIQEGKSAEEQAKYNARMAEIQADDARARGAVEANKVRQDTKRAIATQQTQLAANGVDTASGSSLTLMSDTARAGEIDAKTAEVNAMREAFGYQSQAESYRFSGKAAKQNAYGSAVGSLLTGAGNIGSKWNASRAKKA